MYPISNDNLLNVGIEACLAASNVVMDAANLPRVSSKKGKTDLVTETDLLSEKVIKSTIRSEFDDHSIMAEESGKELTQSDYLWIIDPLDGTTNFVHGYPSYGISIGLYHKCKPLLGIVMEMPNVKLYTAVNGGGAFCEGQKITPSDTETLNESLLVTGFGYEHLENWKKNMSLFKHFTDITQGVRRLGAAAIDICHVASGLVDGYWEYDLKQWDMAAGLIIASEAGCRITDIRGKQHQLEIDNVVVTNKLIHDELISESSYYLNCSLNCFSDHRLIILSI